MNRRSPLSAAALVAISAFVAWGWLAMMLLHELGHVAAASATGGRIASVELRPGWLSHTLVAPNPCPSVVVWSGLASGWIAPQLTAPLWRIERFAAGPLLRAWAAFCLLGTGSYLADRRRRAAHRHRPTDRCRLAARGARGDRRRRRRARLRSLPRRRRCGQRAARPIAARVARRDGLVRLAGRLVRRAGRAPRRVAAVVRLHANVR